MSNLHSLLTSSGLSEKEAQVYLAGIELGEASIQRLAEQADLKRPTVYDIVASLEKKGVFSMVTKKKKRYFLAEDPENVLALLKARQHAFLEALPELKLLFQTGGKKPRVRFYEGVEGLKAMYWDTLESKGVVLAYGAITEMWEAVSQEFINDYVRERVKRKIFMRGIVPATHDSQEYARRDKQEMRHLLLVSAAKFVFQNEINIYNDKVAIFSFPEKIGVIIESQKIAETQRAIFELAWLGALQAT